MTQTKSSSAFTLMALMLFTVLFVFFMYTFLHEAGHAIVGLVFGQSLSELNLRFWDFSAHVDLVGGSLTRSQLAVRAAAGTGLPLLIWTGFISLMPRQANFTLGILRLISSMAVINTLAPWIVAPVLFLFGQAPADDVTNFLHYSQIPPLLLTFITAVLYTAGWKLFLSRINGWRNEFLRFQQADLEQMTAGAQTTIPVLAGFLIFFVSLTFTVNNLASGNSVKKFSPPPDFTPAVTIALANRSYLAESLATFKVDKPSLIGVFIVIRNIDTRFFDLSVIGPDGFSSVVLHGEGYKAEVDGGLWQHNLLPGIYQVVLTSQQSPGVVALYLQQEQ